MGATSTPSVADIAEALATALGTVDGLHVSAYIPDTFTPPVAVVDIEGVDYGGAFGTGDVVHSYTVFVIVARVSDRAGIATLEGFMSQAGNPTSIQGAIERDQTLGGVVSTLQCEKSGPVSALTIGDVVYLTCPFQVSVHA